MAMMSQGLECMEGERPAQRRAVSHGESKVTRERVGLLVLGVLLAAAAIVIYRLFFEYLRAKDHLQTLTEENAALRRNLTDSNVEWTCWKKKPDIPTMAGWELHGGKCYYFSSTQSSWEESSCWCKSQGGDLVKVESKEQQIFLNKQVRKLMVDHEDMFWIGLTDAEEEGTWLWADGSPLQQSLTFWHKGQPDNLIVNFAEGQDCVRMGGVLKSDPLRTWFDRSCVVQQRFVCEKQAPTGNSTCA